MNILLTVNWNNTWIVVGLGIGLVLTILAMLVLLLLLWQKANVALSPKQEPSAAPVIPKDETPQVAVSQRKTTENADVAAIATALFLYFDEVHDTESAVLTFTNPDRRFSTWNSKIQSMNNLNF